MSKFNSRKKKHFKHSISPAAFAKEWVAFQDSWVADIDDARRTGKYTVANLINTEASMRQAMAAAQTNGYGNAIRLLLCLDEATLGVGMDLHCPATIGKCRQLLQAYPHSGGNNERQFIEAVLALREETPFVADSSPVGQMTEVPGGADPDSETTGLMRECIEAREMYEQWLPSVPAHLRPDKTAFEVDEVTGEMRISPIFSSHRSRSDINGFAALLVAAFGTPTRKAG